MPYTIEKYRIKKHHSNRWFIEAKVYRKNIFGSIKDISWEILDSSYNVRHEHIGRLHRRILMVSLPKKEAKIVVKTLNKRL